jgi:thiamine biosynthesis lipoprotein
MRPEAAVEAHHFEALGTRCSLFGVGISRGQLLDGERRVHEMGSRFTRFSRSSELARLNAAGGGWVDISPELEDLLRQSLRIHETTGGLVNVAVLPAMLAIGYTRPLSEGPTVARLDAACPAPSLTTVLTVRSGRARLAAGCGLDLGGVAKGWMADRLAACLGGNVVVNLGGDLFAAGAGPPGDGWPVGFADRTVMLRDQGAATSSVRRRRWGEVHHLIDPRTGLPARTGLEEVSVVARSGLEAEAVAKAALLLGPELAPTYCAAHALAWSLSP